MTLPQVIARNAAQKIQELLFGSLITVIGSGGHTEAAIGDGIVTSYEPGSGKKARVKVTFSVAAMGTNTVISCGVNKISAGRYVPTIELTAIGSRSFETVIEADHQITFRGDNAADDGTAGCTMEVTELPA